MTVAREEVAVAVEEAVEDTVVVVVAAADMEVAVAEAAVEVAGKLSYDFFGLNSR